MQEHPGPHVNRVEPTSNYGDSLIGTMKKVLSPEQIGIVVDLNHAATWLSSQENMLLLNRVRNENDIAVALEQKLINSQSFAKFVWAELKRTIFAARMPGSGLPDLEQDLYDRITEVTRVNGQRYKVNLDSYSLALGNDFEFHAVIALLTPAGSDLDDLSYEQAQLSTIRYNSGLTNFVRGHRDLKPSLSTVFNILKDDGNASEGLDLQSPTSTSAAKPLQQMEARKRTENTNSRSTSPLGDFIPTMSTAEVDYFYSLVPHVNYDGEENGTQRRPSSILEQARRVQDPDDIDPYWKLRQSQASVIPMRPRKLEEAVAASQPVHENKCLDCGTTKSPEWRKGPLGPKTLCNRCGLRWAKRLKVS